ncbi:MAG: hypothetical protein IKA83_04950 [Paludibacteraceae bacterium]|nr:hypothetical protein [Paludibacteraceae bacterium]
MNNLDNKWDNLSEEEKERFFLDFMSNPANERIAGYRIERHKGKDGKWVYDFIDNVEQDDLIYTNEQGKICISL